MIREKELLAADKEKNIYPLRGSLTRDCLNIKCDIRFSRRSLIRHTHGKV